MVYKCRFMNGIATRSVQMLNRLRPCLLCQSASAWYESPFTQLCHACRVDLPYILNPCFYCGIELPEGSDHGAVCAQCQQRDPVYTRCIAPFHFQPPMSALIHEFKDNGNFAFGACLAALTCQHLSDHLQDAATPDCLIPMPLHTGKLRSRGFNQSIVLASALSKQLALPMHRRLLIQSRPTQEQKTLNRKQRRRNMRDAFTLRQHEDLRDRHIALIDDVVTSQATVNEASRVLLKEGAAARVDVYCIARVDMK